MFARKSNKLKESGLYKKQHFTLRSKRQRVSGCFFFGKAETPSICGCLPASFEVWFDANLARSTFIPLWLHYYNPNNRS